MGKQISLSAADGHQFAGYRADPEGKPKGGVVVIQEIFGVNTHIRSVCDRFAREGYVAVAPALFDRTQKGFESGYTPAEIEKARAFVAKPDWDAMLLDVNAAVSVLKSSGPVAVVGFCLGGSVAFLSAVRLSGLSAAVGYYGGAIVKFADEKPKCAVQLHFGEQDHGIPLTDVARIKEKRPDVEIYTYPDAGHGFHCDE
ncbi:MAG TPA: dienelactone hydrolase family protein, partial [Beijerinckiaceae bacterium]|nr:dienelactone hydrolase family protein [Beijerinckiaceae bacterium]